MAATRNKVTKQSPKREKRPVRVSIQDASDHQPLPEFRRLRDWIRRAAKDLISGEISVRIVGEAESALLNERYRHRSGPTNVLAFAGPAPPESSAVRHELIGDIVICAPVVASEAKRQGKTLDAHWAHIAIHGVLHLLGYDHAGEPDAMMMEKREVELLQTFGFEDPYAAER
jgi:probable rRNA maturation factor